MLSIAHRWFAFARGTRFAKVHKRNTKPGQHGAMALRKKQSDYGNQLFAKQKLKFYYGDLTEKQFKSIFAKASNIKGNTSQILIELLERRLDAIV